MVVFINHATLKQLSEKKDTTPRLILWITLLQQYDLKLKIGRVVKTL